MPTTAEVEDFDQAVRFAQILMVAALVERFKELTAGDPAEAVDELRTLVLDLVAEYGQAVAAEAIDFYDSVRPPGAPSFNAAPVVRDDLVTGPSLNWSTTPLLTEDPQKALDRMAAEAQKATFQAAIETIGEATEEDPLEVRYARFPQNDNPCAYCVLRASRGAVFYSETTATRGDHVQCRCSVTPVFSDEPLPYLKAPYLKAYYAGVAESEGDGFKSVLSGMRRANGSR